MPVAGLRGTGDWGADERPKDFRESILWMQPNGDTPLLGLSSQVKGKKRVVTDPEFSWWNEPMDIVRLQVSAEAAAGDTVITVDSGDPTAANIKQNFGKATHLTPGDILMVEPATDSAVDDYERVMVTAVHSETQFSVTRGVSGTTPATIADDAHLLLVGSAFAEGTAGPQATTRNPIKFWNYTQIFKTGYEITGTADATFARTGNALQNDKKRRMFDHGKKLEMAMLFGRKHETVGPNGKPLRFMGGIREFIPAANQHVLAANWGLAKSAAAGNNLLDMMSPVFDYSSPGGDTRVVFCGNGALNALNRAIVSASGAGGMDISWGGKEKYWGMNFRELLFPQGRFMLKTHPLMSRHALYTNSMLILDFSAIHYAPLKGRDNRAKDDIQSKDEDVRRGQWECECSIMVDYAGQTLGYIGGFNQNPA